MKGLKEGIFATVFKEDYLSFYQHKKLDYDKVKHLLDFGKEDISRATGIPLKSIRFDTKVPRKVEKRMTEWANLLNLVAGHFKGDPIKTALWFTTRNPLLGSMSPRDMIRLGRYKKLFNFIFNSLSENKR